nr:hypothetical protein [uncultured Draconibacterium sp.]
MKPEQRINTFSDLYEKTVTEDNLLSSFMTGHLVIEFLLVRIIKLSQPKLVDFAEGLNHYKLIQLVFGLSYIDEKQKEVLLLINKMRNKFAHHLTFEPTIIELEEILTKASKAFNDMTDGLEQGLDEVKGKRSIRECEEWVIPEMFVQISYDLHDIYQNLGGDMEDF